MQRKRNMTAKYRSRIGLFGQRFCFNYSLTLWLLHIARMTYLWMIDDNLPIVKMVILLL